jgi:N-acetylmuramoyl-L-alanine amidase
MRNINLIIIHCSATKEGQNFHLKDIDRWHRERGYKKVGYHYVIDLDGTVEKGRDESEIGAHCQGKNKNSIGICYVGGLDINGKPKDTRTKEQKEALWNLLRELLVKYPKATIHGHRDFANKACPSFDVSKEYDIINLRDNIG